MRTFWKSGLTAAVLGGSLVAANLFPLREGNNWTYRETRTGRTFSVEVGAAVPLNGQTYYTLIGYVDQTVLARLDDQGRLVYVDQVGGMEAVLTSFVPVDGGWWDAPFRACTDQGQASGATKGLLQVRYRTSACADAGIVSEQYAENIGMVQRVVESIAGPRRSDLIHAKVGDMVIDTLPHALFSVSIDDRPAAAVVMATLRLQTNSPVPLTLQFGSGQEYDLVLRSTDGKVVWKWSDGQSFIQTLHQTAITGEWSVTVAVPRPPAAADPYTLQGWLTTIGDPPQFAATVPVAIGQ